MPGGYPGVWPLAPAKLASLRIVASLSQGSTEESRQRQPSAGRRAEAAGGDAQPPARRAPPRLVGIKANLRAAVEPSFSTQKPPDARGAAPRGGDPPRAAVGAGRGARRRVEAAGRGGARAGEGGARGAGARGGYCGLWRRHPAEPRGSSEVLRLPPLAGRAGTAGGCAGDRPALPLASSGPRGARVPLSCR